MGMASMRSTSFGDSGLENDFSEGSSEWREDSR
jgi:hypothetical protein